MACPPICDKSYGKLRTIFGKILLQVEVRFAAYDERSFVVNPGSNSSFHLSFKWDYSFSGWSACAHPETYPGSRMHHNKDVAGTDREEGLKVLHEYLADPQWSYGAACALIK
jgi:hypothetical protein